MTEPRLPESDSTLPDRMVAERRRLILQALGKGGAAMAALSPLASHAARTHKIANNTLNGGFGYCSVSGFQSAAISGTPNTVCSTYSPGHFLSVETLVYATLTTPSSPNASRLASALNTKYFGGASVISNTQAGGLMTGTKVVVPTQNLVILPGTTPGTSGIALRLKNSSALPDGTTLFKAAGLFTNSTSTLTLVETLYEAVISSTPTSGRSFILAAYLSARNNASTGTLPVGFDTTYIVGTYTSDADLLSGTKTYNFYRALAVTA